MTTFTAPGGRGQDATGSWPPRARPGRPRGRLQDAVRNGKAHALRRRPAGGKAPFGLRVRATDLSERRQVGRSVPQGDASRPVNCWAPRGTVGKSGVRWEPGEEPEGTLRRGRAAAGAAADTRVLLGVRHGARRGTADGARSPSARGGRGRAVTADPRGQIPGGRGTRAPGNGRLAVGGGRLRAPACVWRCRNTAHAPSAGACGGPATSQTPERGRTCVRSPRGPRPRRRRGARPVPRADASPEAPGNARGRSRPWGTPPGARVGGATATEGGCHPAPVTGTVREAGGEHGLVAHAGCTSHAEEPCSLNQTSGGGGTGS